MRRYLIFTAEWCKPCKNLKTSVELLQKLDGELQVEYKDVDQELELRDRYAIRGVPTVIRLGEDGKEQKRMVGFTDLHELNMFFSNEEVQ
jgi:thioredoxin 1